MSDTVVSTLLILYLMSYHPVGRGSHLPFLHKETEIQKGRVPCPRPHFWEVSGSDSNSGLSELKGHLSDSSEMSAGHISNRSVHLQRIIQSGLFHGKETDTGTRWICPLLPGDQHRPGQDHRSGGPWKEPH